MNEKMRLSNNELSMMSLFEGLTEVFPVACRIYDNDVFFIVNKKDFYKLLSSGLRIFFHQNKRNKSKLKPSYVISFLISELGRNVNKNIHITFYDGNLESFIRNFFRLSKYDAVAVREAADGGKYVIINVDPARRGKIIGRKGVRAKVGREFAKVFFDVKSIIIK